jgi:hypothetical protein
MKVVTYVMNSSSEPKEEWKGVRYFGGFAHFTLSQCNLQVSHLIDLHIHVLQLRTICFKANQATFVTLHTVRNLTTLKNLNKRCKK